LPDLEEDKSVTDIFDEKAWDTDLESDGKSHMVFSQSSLVSSLVSVRVPFSGVMIGLASFKLLI